MYIIKKQLKNRKQLNESYWQKYEQHLMVEQYLDEAAVDPRLHGPLCDSIDEIARDIASGIEEYEFSATKKIAFLLLYYGSSKIDMVIQNGIVPHLQKIVVKDLPDEGYLLKRDAVRALNVILRGSTDQARVVMEYGGAASYAALLTHEKAAVKFEAVMGLERAASHSIMYRNELLDLGVAAKLATFLDTILEQSDGALMVHLSSNVALSGGTSALRWLCSWDPLPTLNQVEIAVPTLRRLISLDGENLKPVVHDACFALYALSRGPPERLQTILDAQLYQRLVSMLNVPGPHVDSALTFIRFIFGRPDDIIQGLVDSGVFPALHNLLIELDFQPNWRKACSCISMLINGGGRDRVEMILDADLTQLIVNIALDEFLQVETGREAVCALANAARRGSFPQIADLHLSGALLPICQYMRSASERTRNLCVEALWKFLHEGSLNKLGGINIFEETVASWDGFFRLLSLRNEVRCGDRARLILTRYN